MLAFSKVSNGPLKRDASSVACSIDGIYVINLESSKDRLEEFSAKCEKEGLEFQRWEAVDGRKLDRRTLWKAGASQWALSDQSKKRKGEIGCFLSHRSLWYSLQNLPSIDTSGYLILEDDAIFEENFTSKLSEALRYVPPDWDFVFVGHGNPKWIGTQGPVRKLHQLHGFFGYIIRAKTIKRILKYFWLIGEPIDVMLNRFSDKLNLYGLYHPLITPDFDVASTILIKE
jgi:glycosyl transferase family 25